jgi:hypothetical protein
MIKPDYNTSNRRSRRRPGANEVIAAPSVFTINNAVVVAVLQVGVVVAGCLGAALSFRLTAAQGGLVRLPTLLLLHYWFAFMAMPLLWISTALALRRRGDVSMNAKAMIFWLGVFLLAALVVLAVCGFLGPLALDGLPQLAPAAEL